MKIADLATRAGVAASAVRWCEQEGALPAPDWGLDDPSVVEGSDEDKVVAFRRTETEVSARLRPFIEAALRAADRPRRPALA